MSLISTSLCVVLLRISSHFSFPVLFFRSHTDAPRTERYLKNILIITNYRVCKDFPIEAFVQNENEYKVIISIYKS